MGHDQRGKLCFMSIGHLTCDALGGVHFIQHDHLRVAGALTQGLKIKL